MNHRKNTSLIPNEGSSDKKTQRANVKKFLHKIINGVPKMNAFHEVFPSTVNWPIKKVYYHINTILAREASKDILKKYRKDIESLLDQKKTDMLLYIESIIYDESGNVTISDKVKAINSFINLSNSIQGKMNNTNVLISISDTKEKINKINEIFGIEEDIIDVQPVNETSEISE